MNKHSFLWVLFFSVSLVVGSVGGFGVVVCALIWIFFRPVPGLFWEWSAIPASTGLSLAYMFSPFADAVTSETKTRVGYLRERKEAVYENLRDLNFEYKAGKVPDLDYESMRTSLENEAAAIMAEIARLDHASGQAI